MQSGMQVQVRAIKVTGTPAGREITPYAWETNTLWFDPSRYYANFVIIDLSEGNLPAQVGRLFGKPVEKHRVANYEILIFKKNLLELVKPPKLPPTS
jgi:hypothetical protein